MERESEVSENIYEILDGVKKLSGKDDFKFRYYKGFRSFDATQDKISEMVPTDPDKYGISMQENALNNYKTFFSNSYVDNIAMNENKITVKKKFSDSLVFEFIDFGDTLNTIKQLNESFDILNSYPEILFLTTYLGDYNISKYGDNLVFENEDKALVLKRI